MRRLLVTLFLFWELVHFANDALRVLPTIVYRGLVPAIELAGYGAVAALCAAAAMAWWHDAPAARRLVTVAIIASVARTVQSLYGSSLPNDTIPGDEPFTALTAVILGSLALALALSKRTSPPPRNNR